MSAERGNAPTSLSSAAMLAVVLIVGAPSAGADATDTTTGAGGPTDTTTPGGAPTVRFDEHSDTLSVSADAVPLADLLGAVALETGVEVTLHGTNHGPVTLDFEDVPLEAALHRIVGEWGLIAVRSPDTQRVEKIWVLSSRGRSSGAVARPEPRDPKSADPGAARGSEGAVALLRRLGVDLGDTQLPGAGQELLDRLLANHPMDDLDRENAAEERARVVEMLRESAVPEALLEQLQMQTGKPNGEAPAPGGTIR